MKMSSVPPLECCHADTCLPDYWGGHHLPHVSIPVHRGMSMSDIKRALHFELSSGAVAGSNPITRYDSGEAGDVWYKRAHAAVDKIKPATKGQKRFFLDLGEQEEDADYSVYAYFVFKPE